MTDRRALLIGHWGPEDEPGPSHQKINALISRWESLLAIGERYPFGSIDNKGNSPKALKNPKNADLTSLISDNAAEITNETLLLLYYVGHSRPRGAEDIDLALWYDKKDERKRYVPLSRLLEDVGNIGVGKLVLIIDSCHAGRARDTVYRFPRPFFALVSTGDNYSFDCVFSEQLLNTLERKPHKSDQRIDRRENGFTYQKLFEVAYSGFLRHHARIERKVRQEPQHFGELGTEVIKEAPPSVSKGYNPFAPTRTIYGRVYCALNVLCGGGMERANLISILRSRSEFLLRRGEDEGQHRYVGEERCKEYVSFLERCEFVGYEGKNLVLTDSGRAASQKDEYNERILDAIEKFILPEDVSIEFLDGIVKQLLVDLVPATPSNLCERILMKGTYFQVDEVIKLGLAVLPSTGRFMKGSADALYPCETKLD